MQLKPLYRLSLTLLQLAWVGGAIAGLLTAFSLLLSLQSPSAISTYLLAAGIAGTVSAIFVGLAARRCSEAIALRIERDEEIAFDLDPSSEFLRWTWIRYHLTRALNTLSVLLVALAFVGSSIVYSEFEEHRLAICIASAGAGLLSLLLRPVVWFVGLSEGLEKRLKGHCAAERPEWNLGRFPWAATSVVILGVSLFCAPALINASVGQQDAFKPTGLPTLVSYLLMHGTDIVSGLVASYREHGIVGNDNVLVLICAIAIALSVLPTLAALFVTPWVIMHEWPTRVAKNFQERSECLASAKRGFLGFSLLAFPLLALGYLRVPVLPTTVFVYLHCVIVVSFLTVMVFAMDKWHALSREGRVPEAHLHLFEILGGWPGAWLAMRLLNHKIKKDEYESLYNWMVIAHCLLVSSALWFTVWSVC